MSFQDIGAGAFNFDASKDITKALDSGKANTEPAERNRSFTRVATDGMMRTTREGLVNRAISRGSRLDNDMAFNALYKQIASGLDVEGAEAGMSL